MSATAALPVEFGRHWVKRLAAIMGVPTETARHWAFRRMPDARRKEIAQALIAECDRLTEQIADTRRRWEQEATTDDTSSETRRRGTTEGTGAAVARREADRNGPLVR